MKSLFWLLVGTGLGVFGHRYYQMNGGRLPFLEQLTGRPTSDMMNEASRMGEHLQRQGQDTVDKLQRKGQETVDKLQHKGQETLNEQVGNVTRQAVVAAAEEIADAEEAKRREQPGQTQA